MAGELTRPGAPAACSVVVRIVRGTFAVGVLVFGFTPATCFGEISPKQVAELRGQFDTSRDALGAFAREEFGLLDERLRSLEEKSQPRAPKIQGGRFVRVDNALSEAELGEFRRALEATVAKGRDAGRREATFRLNELREALGALPVHLDAAAATARDQVQAFLAREGTTELADASLKPVCRQAPELLEKLEAGVRGASCQADLDEVARLLKPATVSRALDLLVASLARPCLTQRLNRGVRDEFRFLADGLLETPPNIEDLPLGKAEADRLRKQIAPFVPGQSAALLASIGTQEPATPAPLPEAKVSPPGAVGGTGTITGGDTIAGGTPRSTSPQPPAAAATASAAGTRPELSGPSPSRPNWLALDVWQSAWGDFAEIDSLLGYLRRNRITEVYLNPGFAMSPPLRAEGRRSLEKLVGRLRSAGVKTVHFLYAELNYPVSEYAAFLRENRDLGLTMLADDSEFTDARVDGFRRNRLLVQKEGILYSAFVTVEQHGNSGVSDETRLWAIENLDQTIFMSYFSCDLPGQKAALEPLLVHADRLGRTGHVKIAILAGSKRFGKEASCEKVLGSGGLVSFLKELHGWARSHPSYGGIVLETNERFPSFDVAPEPW